MKFKHLLFLSAFLMISCESSASDIDIVEPDSQEQTDSEDDPETDDPETDPETDPEVDPETDPEAEAEGLVAQMDRVYNFHYTYLTGIGHEAGCTRRDPSDIIIVDGVYYAYYTKVFGRPGGYWGTIYGAKSNDGYNWTEFGEVIGLGAEGKFDSYGVFTPNVIYADGKYYLFYTGVCPTPGNEEGEFENNGTSDYTNIGLMSSSSPEGPFVRVSEDPVLTPRIGDSVAFDGYRIDDSVLLYRDGEYRLYYKGRAETGGAAGTEMGFAYSSNIEGPYEKYSYESQLDESHEVLVWLDGDDVCALASWSSLVHHSPDGINFGEDVPYYSAVERPHAPGAFREDLTIPNTTGGAPGLEWGLSMIYYGNECYLIRYDVDVSYLDDITIPRGESIVL